MVETTTSGRVRRIKPSSAGMAWRRRGFCRSVTSTCSGTSARKVLSRPFSKIRLALIRDVSR